MNIFIDTKGESSLLTRDQLIDSDDKTFDFANIGLEPTQLKIGKVKKQKTKISSEGDIDLDQFESDMGWGDNKNKNLDASLGVRIKDVNVDDLLKSVNPIENILKKSVIVPGFEKLEAVPQFDVSRRQRLAESKRERARTKGKKWFNLPATEMTPEIKHDLQVIQMRSVLDPKHFYKKNDMKSLPKYFQIGKVIDSPIDYYNGRLTKKEKKKTIVDELMADAEFAKYNKRKYREIINSNHQGHSKAHKHAKKLKGKKK